MNNHQEEPGASPPMQPSDAVVQHAATIRTELDHIHDLERQILRARHRIGASAASTAQHATAPGGSATDYCSATVERSRYWLSRHAHAFLAMQSGGQDSFEVFVSRLTVDGDVLSPKQYLDYGSLRSGEERRTWRKRIYGEDILGKAD